MYDFFGLWAFLAVSNALSQPTLTIEVAIREPASSFEIIDNVSNWWPGYNEPEYRAYWEDVFGISQADAALFSKYKLLREKYFDKSGQSGANATKNRSGLFTDATTLTADPIGHAFYQSASFNGVFNRLRRFLLPEEVTFLKLFFEHFAEQLSPLTNAGSKAVAGSLKRTKQVLNNPEVIAYLNQLSKFLGVDHQVHFTALYVWWPDAEKVRANPNGPYLLIRLQPFEGENVNSADVIVHEAVHALIAAKSTDSKKSLSDAILNAFPDVVKYTSRLGVIEEPLATILGNMEFRRRFDPRRFAWGRKWYGDQWVDLMARLFYPSVMEAMRNGKSLDQAITKDGAALLRIGVTALHPSDP